MVFTLLWANSSSSARPGKQRICLVGHYEHLVSAAIPLSTNHVGPCISHTCGPLVRLMGRHKLCVVYYCPLRWAYMNAWVQLYSPCSQCSGPIQAQRQEEAHLHGWQLRAFSSCRLQIVWAHPHFITRFRGPVPHLAYLQCRTGVLPQVTLCAKVGLHPHSLHFPLGYLEVSFKDALVLLFVQLRPEWCQHFEGSYLPFLIFDFLDGHRATISGKVHFTENGLFVIDWTVRTEDSLCTNPHLFAFVPTPRTPVNLLSLVGYADETITLVHT